MKCLGCGFELPTDWPLTKIKAPDREAPLLQVAVCAPCMRRWAAVQAE